MEEGDKGSAFVALANLRYINALNNNNNNNKRMSDDQDGCEWVNISSGTGLPG